jgi:hypothetical protein
MTRKRNFFMVILILLILSGLGGGLYLLVEHEPGFYRRCLPAAGKERQDLSKACFGQFVKLANNLLEGPTEPWDVTFSEAQLNSYFVEDFIRLGDAENLKKRGISEPRLNIEKDRLRLAFRCTTPLGSTVFSIDMRIWLVPNEINMFAVEILGRHIGALPFSVQSLLDEITDLARKQNIDVTWYRHEGNPVALLRVQSDRPRHTAKFLRFDLQPGTLTIGGVSLEPLPPNAQTRRMLAPVGN